MQFTLPEQSNWYDNMPIHLYNYAQVLPVKVSRPYFSTRLQGARQKFGVGDETMSRGIKKDEYLVFTCKLMHMGKQWTQGVLFSSTGHWEPSHYSSDN